MADVNYDALSDDDLLRVADGELNEDEEVAVLEFINDVPEASSADALKFLTARKFNVDRAVQLYNNYQNIIAEYQFENIGIIDVAEELKTKKMYLPGTVDKKNATLFILNAKDFTTGQTDTTETLKLAFYLGEVALSSYNVQNTSTQRNGITIVSNMEGVGWSNFDSEFQRKVIEFFQNNIPAKVRNIYLYQPPWWTNMMVRVGSVFVKAKIRERIVMCYDLKEHIDEDQLPVDLGGTFEYDHEDWMDQRLELEKRYGGPLKSRRRDSAGAHSTRSSRSARSVYRTGQLFDPDTVNNTIRSSMSRQGSDDEGFSQRTTSRETERDRKRREMEEERERRRKEIEEKRRQRQMEQEVEEDQYESRRSEAPSRRRRGTAADESENLTALEERRQRRRMRRAGSESNTAGDSVRRERRDEDEVKMESRTEDNANRGRRRRDENDDNAMSRRRNDDEVMENRRERRREDDGKSRRNEEENEDRARNRRDRDKEQTELANEKSRRKDDEEFKNAAPRDERKRRKEDELRRQDEERAKRAEEEKERKREEEKRQRLASEEKQRLAAEEKRKEEERAREEERRKEKERRREEERIKKMEEEKKREEQKRKEEREREERKQREEREREERLKREEEQKLEEERQKKAENSKQDDRSRRVPESDESHDEDLHDIEAAIQAARLKRQAGREPRRFDPDKMLNRQTSEEELRKVPPSRTAPRKISDDDKSKMDQRGSPGRDTDAGRPGDKFSFDQSSQDEDARREDWRRRREQLESSPSPLMNQTSPELNDRAKLSRTPSRRGNKTMGLTEEQRRQFQGSNVSADQKNDDLDEEQLSNEIQSILQNLAPKRRASKSQATTAAASPITNATSSNANTTTGQKEALASPTSPGRIASNGVPLRAVPGRLRLMNKVAAAASAQTKPSERPLPVPPAAKEEVVDEAARRELFAKPSTRRDRDPPQNETPRRNGSDREPLRGRHERNASSNRAPLDDREARRPAPSDEREVRKPAPSDERDTRRPAPPPGGVNVLPPGGLDARQARRLRARQG